MYSKSWGRAFKTINNMYFLIKKPLTFKYITKLYLKNFVFMIFIFNFLVNLTFILKWIIDQG